MQSLKFTIKENTREKYQGCREVTFRLQPMLEAWSFFLYKKTGMEMSPNGIRIQNKKNGYLKNQIYFIGM